jgi:hypothetical protein
MPLQKLQFRPGVNREGTTLANEGGWFQCDKIRFRSGQVEKIGGWTLDTGTVTSGGNYIGICRSLWNWIALNGYNYLGLGTNQKFYIQIGTGGNLYDITPTRYVAPAGVTTFAATNGSSTIIVNAPGHGAQTGDYVIYSGAVSLGGNVTAAILNAATGYEITYITSNQYSIVVPVTANASDVGTGGASVVATYQITSGNAIFSIGVGWGAGEWGGGITGEATTALNGGINNSVTTVTVVSTTGFPATGTFLVGTELITYSGLTPTTFTGCTRGQQGTTAASHLTGAVVTDTALYTGWGEPAPASQGIGQQLRLWSQANFGQNLIFNPRGGALYYWVVDANPNIVNAAQILASTNTNTQNGVAYWQTDADCPSICNYVLISDASRFVIGFGVNDYSSSTQNQMLIRWSDQEDVLTWTPSLTNQAGSYTLSHGSRIISALQSRQEILIWTDSALYSMQYLGAPFVWGFNILSDNISILSPNVATTISNVAYWMGHDKFYMYSGQVQTLPCTLRQYVYSNINTTQSYQFFSGTNEGYNEVWWFYCSANSNYIDRYVIYNHLEQIWYYGTLTRTAWLDSPLRTFPIAAGYLNTSDVLTSGIIYQEAAVDNGTTNPPSAIPAYIQSSDFDIGDGHNFGFVWRIIPDVSFDGSTSEAPNLKFTVLPRQNPGANYGSSDLPTVTSAQSYVGQSTYNVQQFTQYAYCRIRGRQMALVVSSDAAGTQWQLGSPRLDVRPDGRR